MIRINKLVIKRIHWIYWRNKIWQQSLDVRWCGTWKYARRFFYRGNPGGNSPWTEFPIWDNLQYTEFPLWNGQYFSELFRPWLFQFPLNGESWKIPVCTSRKTCFDSLWVRSVPIWAIGPALMISSCAKNVYVSILHCQNVLFIALYFFVTKV